MQELEMLEDSVDLLYASDEAESRRRQGLIADASAAWKRLTGRDHRGEWIDDKPTFVYGDWRVAWSTYYHSGGSGNIFRLSRRCAVCGEWKQPWHADVTDMSVLRAVYENAKCTNKRKCRR